MKGGKRPRGSSLLKPHWNCSGLALEEVHISELGLPSSSPPWLVMLGEVESSHFGSLGHYMGRASFQGAGACRWGKGRLALSPFRGSPHMISLRPQQLCSCQRWKIAPSSSAQQLSCQQLSKHTHAHTPARVHTLFLCFCLFVLGTK